MLFAAGLGTRLRPLTLARPKPVVPVANRPLGGFAMAHLATAGVTRIVANVHHLADVAEAELRRSAPRGVELIVVREEELLGTGGGLANAWSLLRDGLTADASILVMNSDILFAPDLGRALAHHEALGAIATMVLRPDPAAARYGAVELDGSGRVRRLLGNPERVEASLTPYMFTGVHVLAAEAIEDLPASGCIVQNSYRRWVDSGRVVGGVVETSPWRDLGTLDQYLAANLDLASGELASDLVTPTSDGSLVDPTASIGEGATIERSVIGPGATIASGVRVARSVVWDGCCVDVDVERVCVASNGITAIL